MVRNQFRPLFFLTALSVLFLLVFTWSNFIDWHHVQNEPGHQIEIVDNYKHDTVVHETSILPAVPAKDLQPKTIFFVGDVMLGRHVEVLMGRHGADFPFSGISYAEHDPNYYLIGNFEASIPVQHQPTANFVMRFSVDKEFIPAVKLAGFTHFSLANNHALDYGEGGYLNARKVLTDNSIAPFGHPNQLDENSVTYVETSVGIVSVVGIEAIDTLPDKSTLQALMADVKLKSDWLIAYVHWGTEYSPTSNSSQKKLASWLVESGSDLVLGHHPHVVQEVDLIDGVPVFYSLGNYIFDQYFSTAVLEGLVLQIDFSDTNPKINLIPVTQAQSLSQPRVSDVATSQAFLVNLAEKGHAELQDDIVSGTIALQKNKKLATFDRTVIME